MKTLGWVGEDTVIDVSTEMKDPLWKELRDLGLFEEIGRASCRERV